MIQFLQGQKKVSKSYEYKLKSLIKKKVANLLDEEFPLISIIFPDIDLTKHSKISGLKQDSNLTNCGKESITYALQDKIKAPGPGFEPGSKE